MINYIKKHIYRERYTIGFIYDSLDNIISGNHSKPQWINHDYKRHWFADPFVLKVTKEYVYLLAEEYYDGIKRGRISKLTIDRSNNKLIKIEVALQLDTHLSFPAIIRKDGRIFIYPENCANNSLVLYEYFPDSNECVRLKTICQEPLTDAIVTDVFGQSLLFSTKIPIQNSNKLDVYSLDGNGIYIYNQTILFPSNTARNAGDWFVYNDVVYRPAQDCNKTYGGAVILQKVEKTSDGFSFDDILRIVTDNKIYCTGCHTFNYLDGVCAIDAKGWKHFRLVKIISLLKKLVGWKNH